MTTSGTDKDDAPSGDGSGKAGGKPQAAQDAPREVGGRKGAEPTRYGDWEKNGIASDF